MPRRPYTDSAMRLFIGIPVAGAVVRELSALCEGLRAGTDGFRWSAPESWHITLQFLGDSTEEQYERLAARLGRSIRRRRRSRWAGRGSSSAPGFFTSTWN